jgi:hypothetical protein
LGGSGTIQASEQLTASASAIPSELGGSDGIAQSQTIIQSELVRSDGIVVSAQIAPSDTVKPSEFGGSNEIIQSQMIIPSDQADPSELTRSRGIVASAPIAPSATVSPSELGGSGAIVSSVRIVRSGGIAPSGLLGFAIAAESAAVAKSSVIPHSVHSGVSNELLTNGGFWPSDGSRDSAEAVAMSVPPRTADLLLSLPFSATKSDDSSLLLIGTKLLALSGGLKASSTGRISVWLHSADFSGSKAFSPSDRGIEKQIRTFSSGFVPSVRIFGSSDFGSSENRRSSAAIDGNE